MRTRTKVTTAFIGLALIASTANMALADDKPTADLSVSALSKYVWRGFESSQDSIVLQPSMTVGYKGFSANLWGNIDTDHYSQDPNTNSWTETDATLSYDWSYGPVAMTAGYIYYGLDGAQDSQEVFASASLDTILAPTLTVYRDYDNLAGWYVTLGVSHSIPVKSYSLDLGAQISYLAADDASSYGEVINGALSATEAYSALHDGTLSASMTFPVNEYISITPQLTYIFPLSSDASDLMEIKSIDANGALNNGGDDNFLVGGITFDLAF